MGITVKPSLTATSYYRHFFGSLLAEVSHDEAIVVCIVLRDLCWQGLFWPPGKTAIHFLVKKALVNTVEPRLTATSVILSPVNTANFFLAYW